MPRVNRSHKRPIIKLKPLIIIAVSMILITGGIITALIVHNNHTKENSPGREGMREYLESAMDATSTSTFSNVKIDFQTFTVNIKDREGYQYEIELKLSPWILESNKDEINSAWQQVGSGKTLPSFNDWTIRGKKLESFSIGYNDIRYCVGQMTIKNKTNGWDFTETNPGNPNITFEFNEFTGAYLLGKAFYGNGCIDFGTCEGHQGFNEAIYTSPLMERNSAGPITIVLALPDILSPNNPEGSYYETLKYEKKNMSLYISTKWYGDGESIFTEN